MAAEAGGGQTRSAGGRARRGGPHSSLMFCTNGVLLRMLTQGEGEGEGMEVHATSPQQVLARMRFDCMRTYRSALGTPLVVTL